MTGFQVPKHGPTYSASIVDRCEDLITHGIWTGIHASQLRGWLANFTTDRERYLAACILDALIYRSTDQTVALANQLFQRVLPDLNRLDPLPAPPHWPLLLQENPPLTDPGVRLVPVVRDTDPPTKSAFIVARLLKRHLRISEDWIARPRQVPRLVSKSIVPIFIDDFLGTGDQFLDFVKTQRLTTHLSKHPAVYAPLAAHVDAIGRLKVRFPLLRVTAVETLDNSHRLFHAECGCFNDGENTLRSAKTFYHAFLRKKHLRIYGSDRRGYGHLELAYAFEHAVPDNCLPILWWPPTAAWQPLFPR